MWEWLAVIFFVLVALRVTIKRRGYFLKDKKGKKLSLKQFLSRWKEGVEGTSPLQQKKISLWSFVPLFAGIIWGIVISLMGKTYWLALILSGSLPLTIINFISTLQQYRSIKKIEETMKGLK